ncbi:MAG: hypothetical protein M1818_002517 [Claussenomyces sp. TS43310]|nr:MAG: hypothetical protein M1818_002517 [Claussenomyces sp. TS43310]
MASANCQNQPGWPYTPRSAGSPSCARPRSAFHDDGYYDDDADSQGSHPDLDVKISTSHPQTSERLLDVCSPNAYAWNPDAFLRVFTDEAYASAPTTMSTTAPRETTITTPNGHQSSSPSRFKIPVEMLMLSPSAMTGYSDAEESPRVHADDILSISSNSDGDDDYQVEWTDSEAESCEVKLQQQVRAPVEFVMKSFWELWNPRGADLISQHVACVPNASKSGPVHSGTPSTSSHAGDGHTRNHKPRVRERSSEANEDDNDEKAPKRSRTNLGAPPDGGDSLRLACPFRKHDKVKYNVHDFKTCTLSPFENISRLKEHLYRSHKAPIQCVRCWLVLPSQQALDCHLTVVNMCDLQPGKREDGISLDIEKRLRTKKKTSRDQTAEGRWKEIYQLLFPGEEVPSAWFEYLLEDALPRILPIEEHLRREVPRMSRELIQNELSRQDSDASDLQAVLSRTDRLMNIIASTVDLGIASYRMRATANLIMSPPGSSLQQSSQDDYSVTNQSDLDRTVPPDLPAATQAQSGNSLMEYRSTVHSEPSSYASTLPNPPGEDSSALGFPPVPIPPKSSTIVQFGCAKSSQSSLFSEFRDAWSVRELLA